MSISTLLLNQLSGRTVIDDSVVQTYEDFSLIFKIRHDLVHAIICFQRKLPFGEKNLTEIMSRNKIEFKSLENFDLIKNQTPDVMVINEKKVSIIELTITQAEKADLKKYSKYSLLIHFFKNNGYEVNMEVIVINPERVNLHRDRLMRENHLV